jgi:formylglycine-generating enzyme required for sulfatase activity
MPRASRTKQAKPFVGGDAESLRLAIRDLAETFGSRYPGADGYLQRLEALAAPAGGVPAASRDAFLVLQREALLANPLLDFDKLLLVKRGEKKHGLPLNWESNSSLPKTGYDNSIEILSPVRPDGALATLFKPDGGRFVGDLLLHFSGRRMLFSMPGQNGRWQVCEIGVDGTGPRELTGEQPDVDSYDACYLPNGKILFTSTACFVGVPCVYGRAHVTNLYLLEADGKTIRQLTFDQDHNWCPTVLNDGRVLYQRWEYADTPHSNTRLLFRMNPDGTNQSEYYGSNSYWPNAIFYARPVPGHPTMVVGVVGGHHDHPRMGELVLFDPARGRHEASGALQRIPGRGKPVKPIIADGLTRNSWPKFLHPFPLGEPATGRGAGKYFLASMKPAPADPWGIYLVDVFDNLVQVKEAPGAMLLHPTPLRPTPAPPVVPDRVDFSRQDATVYIADLYAGDGLKGVPRGTVKSLRLFTYHFAYQNMGGLLGVVGMDGPWDIKRVLGTVPVRDDGSATFRIPANTPISIQPLDAEGKALQLMRSWMTAMPGEVVQCSGCHEPQNTAPPPASISALRLPPAEIAPWRGPTRGFSYAREVQPAIDRYCVGCHDGRPGPGGAAPDLRGTVKITDWKSVTPGEGGKAGGKFSVGYANLHRYVRRPGIESDYHVLEPMEFHADTTELIQMLRKGHANVTLDAETWDRLVTWIDLNCPYHGTWGEEIDKPGRQRERRRELLKRYANVDDDPEAVPATARAPVAPVVPAPVREAGPRRVECPDWPFDAAEARRRQTAAGPSTRKAIDLGGGVTMELARIPAGEFVLGGADGPPDERPRARVRIARPFWMGTLEVTNRQYARFDPRHDSRVEDKNTYQFGVHGYPANLQDQPVVRVSWREAMDFCAWLSRQSGLAVSLPTEAQWEWACRAGAETPFYFGDLDADFSPFANMADAKLSEFASDPYTVDTPLKNPTPYDDWIPKDSRFNDGALIAVAPGRYRPNAWGLHDMHGNVAEWTRSAYRPYPYRDDDGRDDAAAPDRKVARGGSWRDRPFRCTSSFRLAYPPYQRVYNVGFRVMSD